MLKSSHTTSFLVFRLVGFNTLPCTGFDSPMTAVLNFRDEGTTSEIPEILQGPL